MTNFLIDNKQNEKFLPFEKARAYVIGCNFKNVKEYYKWWESEGKSQNIPSRPDVTYKNKGWNGWGDWLGTGYLPFEEARERVRDENLNNQKEYHEWWKLKGKSLNIPSNPDKTYKNKGWNGWGDWLGTRTIAPQNIVFLPFEEAREHVRDQNLKSKNEYAKWSKSEKKPQNIPSAPNQTYKNKGWNGWGDWLGTGTIAPFNKVYLPFEEARKCVRDQKFKNQKEYREWWKSEGKSQNIPFNPQRTYKNKGWNGWGDWLGTGTIASKNKGFLIFEEARDYVRKLGFKNVSEYYEWSKSERSQNIPSAPDVTYKNKGWNGWGDWLGTGTIANFNKIYLPFEEARELVRDENLKSKDEYKKWSKTEKRPQNIPSRPDVTYKNKGWNGWGDWLGTGTIANQNIVYLSFEEARKLVIDENLKSKHEYEKWSKTEKRPQNIPSNPVRTYKKEFNSWPDWLGLKKVNCWTQNTLVTFFKETILPNIDTYDSATLQIIIIHSGCNNAIKQLAKDHPLRKLLDAKYNDDFEKVKQATIETQNYKATDDIIEEDYEDFEDNDELATQQIFQNTTENNFRNLKVEDIIKAIKSLENAIGINLADEDLAEFLQSNQLHKLWTVIYNSSNPEDEIQIIINA